MDGGPVRGPAGDDDLHPPVATATSRYGRDVPIDDPAGLADELQIGRAHV